MRNRRIWALLIILLILDFSSLFFDNHPYNEDDNNPFNDENNKQTKPSFASLPVKYEWVYNWDSGNDDYSGALEIDSEQNIYTCGSNYLIKFNSSGTQLWNKTLEVYDYVEDIILDNNENIYIILKNQETRNGKLLKYSSSGNLQWSQTLQSRNIGGFQLNLAIDSTDNLIIASEIQGVGEGYSDLYLAKYNSYGGLMWENWWGTSIFEICYDITIDSMGNIYLAGVNQVIGTNTKNFILTKFNYLGEYLWDREWNRNNLDECHAIELDSSENIWLGGYTKISSNNHDFVLLKYDESGNLLLERVWGTNSDEKCYALDIDLQDNIYLSGNYLIKLDKFGIHKWNISFSNIDLIESKDIELDNFRNLYLFGTSINSNLDMCLVKANLLPTISIISPTSYKLFGNSTLEFNIIIDEPFLDSTWYCLNSGINYTFSGTIGMISQVAWDECGNGTVNIRFHANNTWGYEGYMDVIVRKDNTRPQVAIISPKPYQLFGNATVNFNLTIQEPNINTTWYTLNGGISHIFSCSSGTIEQYLWDKCSNGTVVIRFYANDTVSNIGFKEVIVRKDESLPPIMIYSPVPYQLFGNETIDFELYINIPYLDSTWYSLNNGQNYTFSDSSGTIQQVAWDTCENGTVTIRFYANDTLGDIFFQEVIVRKDIHIPIITIFSPLSNQFFSNSSPYFDLLIEDPILNSTWYTLNRSTTKYKFFDFSGKINQTAWDLFGNGVIKIRFYANNSLGNIGSKEVIVHKDISPPIININLPIQFKIFGNSSPNFNISIEEDNLNTIWYCLNNRQNYTFSEMVGKINQIAWEKCENGTIMIRFNANDSAGNLAYKDIIIYKDIIKPEIIINSPYTYQVFGNRTFYFDLTINEPNLNETWYSLNNGLNYSFIGTYGRINWTAWEDCENGTVILKFYAIDLAGNIGIKEIIIRKDIDFITYIDLTGSPIYIDNLDPNYNWLKIATENEWCSGLGTITNPFIIEYIIIDGQNSDNCIDIRNSDVIFIIRGCFLNNSGSSFSGIRLGNTTNGYIIGNYIHDNGYGIYLDNSNGNSIQGNKFYNHQYSGIIFYYSDNNLIFKNMVNKSSYAGIEIKDGSNYNTIFGNNFTNINNYGLIIGGISPKPQNNLIYKNNFINNHQHAAISILYSNTKWDDGTIGNYWDDYQGFDFNGDGIGDKPYYIDIANDEKDRFPIWPYDNFSFEWLITKDYGVWGLSDIGQAVTTDNYGNIYVAGRITVSNDNVVLLKYNALGELQWERDWGGGLMDGASGITIDSFGNIYIVGYTETSTNNEDILVIKYNSNGVLQWTQTWDGGLKDGAEGIAIDSLGDIYITGYTQKNTPDLYNMILIKYNNEGSYQWERTWTYASQSFGKGVAIDPYGYIFVAGFYYGGAGSNMFVVKYDNMGNYEWDIRWGIRHYNFGTDLTIDSEGNVFVSGSTYYSGESSDLCFWKIDGQWGNPIYYRLYDRSIDNDANSIAIDSNDNIFLVGSIGNDFLGTNKIYLVKYDKFGDFQYYEQWGNNLDDIGYGIALNNYDSIFVCGSSESYADNGIDIFLLKYIEFPKYPYISINNGAETTNSTLVTLTLSALYAEEMCFKIGTSGSWSEWEPYKTIRYIYLEGSVNNTVYTISVKFRNSKGETNVINDSILLVFYSPKNTYISINNGAETTNSTLVILTLSALYAEEMCFKNGTSGSWSEWEPYETIRYIYLEGSVNNTIYTIYVKFRNEFGESNPINDDILYLVYPPLNPSIIINDGDLTFNSTSLYLTLSATNANEMCFKNGTSGSWSDWESYQTFKTININNPQNNTIYTVYVKFRNEFGESNPINDDILYLVYPPLNPFIIINDGDLTFNSTSLYLTLSATNANEMCFKIGTSGSWSDWEPFQTFKTININNPQNNTIYTVYVKFRNEFGESNPINDDIIYLTHDEDKPNGKTDTKEISISYGNYYIFFLTSTIGLLLIKKRLQKKDKIN